MVWPPRFSVTPLSTRSPSPVQVKLCTRVALAVISDPQPTSAAPADPANTPADAIRQTRTVDTHRSRLNCIPNHRPNGPWLRPRLGSTFVFVPLTNGDLLGWFSEEAQLGHEDPRFTLRVYAQATSRRDRMAKPQRDA